MDINAGGTTSGAWQSRAVHITFIGGTTFSTDQEPHIQGPEVTISLY